MPSQRLKSLLASVPTTPGVYRMRSKVGDIIYVGKSKSLFDRVNSYFRNSSELTNAKRSMVAKVVDIDWIETASDMEALVLETNLIKELRPKYNILMKDDKNLSWITLTDGPVSEVIRVRSKPKSGTLVGPFASTSVAWQCAAALRKLFHVRTCRMQFAEKDGKTVITAKAGKTPPCLDYHIGICPAPCLLTDKTLAQHRENVEKLKAFLRGGSHSLLEDLRAKMKRLSEEQRYEEAAKIRDEMKALEALWEKQIARAKTSVTGVILVWAERYEKSFATVVGISDGQITSVRNVTLESSLSEPHADRVSALVAETIVGMSAREQLLVAENVSEENQALAVRQKVDIQLPQLGEKKDLISFARTNLLRFAQREEIHRLWTVEASREVAGNILSRLGYRVPEKWPLTFEGYDISHTDGHFTQAARVYMANGKSDPSHYKRYKIKSLADGQIDDYQSHREVAYRRWLEGFRENNFPSLMIIDGGKWQLTAALEGFERAQAEFCSSPEGSETLAKKEIPLPYFASIAKREEEVFVPWKSEGIIFEHGSHELRMLQHLRDESHRFSITGNRRERSKAMKRNLLEELPGIGPKARKKLLALAGSLDNIRSIDEETILTAVNRKQLETLRDHGLY